LAVVGSEKLRGAPRGIGARNFWTSPRQNHRRSNAAIVPLDQARVAKLATLRYLRDCELEDRKRISAALIALIDAIQVE
jgi:hypothetical protein